MLQSFCDTNRVCLSITVHPEGEEEEEEEAGDEEQIDVCDE